MRPMLRVTILVAVAVVFAGAALAADDAKAIYDSKCAMCHGTDGVAKAMGKGSKNFNDPAYTASVDEISKVTLEGKGKMPKMEGKLTAEQVKAVAEYIKTLQPKK